MALGIWRAMRDPVSPEYFGLKALVFNVLRSI
jgi:hypothetical protein